MILAHLSDLHLGYRGYGRARGGRNLRERDVARAFLSAVQELIRLEPDVVVLAGDVFDRPDPPAGALVTLARALETLRSSLPGAPVLMVAGARDTPRAWGDPGALAAFDTIPDVEAATGTPRSVRLRDRAMHVLLLPHRAVLREPHPEVKPDPDARWNVLVSYGEVDVEASGTAAVAGGGGGRRRALVVDTEAWDYVALGHDHGHRVVKPAVVYPGSLERVGPEPWTEAMERKGFVTAELTEGARVRFHEIPGRPVVALAPIRWDPDRPQRMNERIREVSEEVPGGLDGKIVRLRLQGLGLEELDSVDPGLLSALRKRAFHLAVELDEPTWEANPVPDAPELIRGLLADADAELVDLARRALREAPAFEARAREGR